MYGLRKVKLKIKWPGMLEKSTNLVENLKEINYRFHTYSITSSDRSIGHYLQTHA